MRAAATLLLAVLVVILVVAGITEMYRECGPVCWQGLQQARYRH
jgi:hypothetical protein